VAVRQSHAVPHLFLVTQAGHHRESPLRVRLDDLDEAIVSRASERRIDIGGNSQRRQLRIAVADHWMSLDHAVLARNDAHWQITDRGSKNGTRINGRLQRDAVLRDGDLLEMGRTFFIFRTALPASRDPARALDASKFRDIAGFATILPGLGERYSELARLAASKTAILLRGPTGSGKELLAHAVHILSGRPGPFVAVNCAGLPESLVEAELFGHVRGAFTGALTDRVGLVGASAGGTLFLDEIGDLTRPIQGKLLRVLQEQAVRPVGGITELMVDLRIVTATHRDLDHLVELGAFREDLLSRLGTRFELPALAERREDLGVIIDELLGRIGNSQPGGAALSPSALRAILNYPWPRNVRELRNALERASALAEGGTIELAHLPPELRQAPPTTPFTGIDPSKLTDEERIKRDQLIEILRKRGGNVAAVARELGTVRSQIQRWMRRYGIERFDLEDDISA
jgi:DNA-binding NtrC family response regulator